MKQSLDAQISETGLSQGVVAVCPMAKMCMRMMEKRPSGSLLVVAGVLLIGMGVLFFIEPRVLVWLMAAASMFLGGMLLMMAGFIRKQGARTPML